MAIFVNTGLRKNNPAEYGIIESNGFEWLLNYEEQDFTSKNLSNKEVKDAIKAKTANYFVSGQLMKDKQGNPLKKNDEHLLTRDMIILDYDFEASDQITHEEFTQEVSKALAGVNHYIYPTISATQTDVRYRVVIDLSREVNQNEYIYLLKEVVSKGIKYQYDPKAENWSQWQGLPIKTPGNAELERISVRWADELPVPHDIPQDYLTQARNNQNSPTPSEWEQVEHTEGKALDNEEAKRYLEGQLGSYLRKYHQKDYNASKGYYHCLTVEHEDSDPSMSFYHEANEEPHLFCHGCEAYLDIFNLIGIDFDLEGFNEQFSKAKELFNVTTPEYEISGLNSGLASDDEALYRAALDHILDSPETDTNSLTINDLKPGYRKVLTLEEDRKFYENTSPKNQLNSFMDHIKENAEKPVISTGFEELDKLLDGGLYEGLITIGAISSLGKTTFTLQLADQIAQQGKDVIIFSLEMSRYEIMAKTISRLTYESSMKDGKKKDPNKIGTASGHDFNARTTREVSDYRRYNGYTDAYGVVHEPYTDYQKELIERSIKEYGGFGENIFIQEGIGDIGAEQIKHTVEKHIQHRKQTPVVIVDYLQILAAYNDRATDKQNTDRSVLELKRLSRDYEIPVIAISSFNRQNYNEGVNMSAFKESGSVEYSSDIVIGLQFARQRALDRDNANKRANEAKKILNHDEEKKKIPREIELKILKNRNGQTGKSLDFIYNQLFNHFEDTTADLSQDYQFTGELAGVTSNKEVQTF